MQSPIDLHSHSTCSDGALNPKDLVFRAADQGVKCLALTDHDTIKGLAEAENAANECGIQFVNGVEVSSQWKGRSIHVVGLQFDPESRELKAFLQSQLDSRLERTRKIAVKLQKLGLPDLEQDVYELAGEDVPGRPHFAQAMIARQLVPNFESAFKQYLGAGKAGDVSNSWPDIKRTISVIRKCGGVSVIAHPRKYQMTLTKLRELIAEFASAGGDGMEVITSGQRQGDVGMLGDLCRRFGLKGSLGSDFHSPAQSWAELGKIPSLPNGVEPIWGDWET